jgi:hypothetical protein
MRSRTCATVTSWSSPRRSSARPRAGWWPSPASRPSRPRRRGSWPGAARPPSPRHGMAWCWRRPAWTSPTRRRAPWCCSPRTRTSRPGGCARRCTPGPGGPSGSSSPTPWAGRGGPGRPTTRSGRPAWCRSGTTAARPTRSATSWRSRSRLWPTRSPRPRIWSRASRPACRWPWCGAWRAWSPSRTGPVHGHSSGPPRRTCSGSGRLMFYWHAERSGLLPASQWIPLPSGARSAPR